MTGAGRIRRVAGPLVEVDGAGPAAMNDLIALGADRLPGEVVAIRDGMLSVQAYEYTGGLAPGAVAVPQGRPLSAELGPWLLGGVFDGLLRPLSSAQRWLGPGAYQRDGGRTWHVRPVVTAGVRVAAGDVLAVAGVPGPLAHRVLVPPDVAGAVEHVVAAGEYPPDATLAVVAGTPITLTESWPVRRPRPARGRSETVEPLHTGQRVLDLLFPVTRGGTAAVPGGFGTGKTVLLQQLAKWCDADIIVYVGCGERGNEMAEIVADLLELIDPRTGGRLADRTVIIANTSNMPMMAREASIYTGITVAEYFRDMGYHAVVIADSTSRWAEALREFASRTGELPAEEGYPANLASALAAFYERAGAVDTLGGRPGSVTVLGAVSPPGGDTTEPVTAHTERFVSCRWSLDRDLAYSRHYPAVSWSASFSRDADALGARYVATGDVRWSVQRGRMVRLLAEADRLVALTELVGVGALPGHERMAVLGGRLLREAVLQQNALSDNDGFCTAAKSSALVDAVLAVIDRCQDVVTSGVPATVVEEIDFGPLIRAREDSAPDDTATAGLRRDAILARLEELR
ncbi:V-type ATP synthase subunit A [Promicromonospora soli]